MTIQLPPLSSSRTGPPQKLDRQATEGPTTPRLRHTVLERRTPRDRSRRPRERDRRLPAAAYPRTSDVRILAKGQSSTDLIHTQSTEVFGSFGHPHAIPFPLVREVVGT